MPDNIDLLDPATTFDNLPLSTTIDDVSGKVKGYLTASTAEATLKAYKSDIEHFRNCGGKIPCSEQVIANYLAEVADYLCVSTLERRLAALSKIHQSLGLPNPTKTDLVQTTMRGIKRSKGRKQRQVAPLTPERLRLLLSVCSDGLIGARDRALLLIGFAGALRRSELVALKYDHVEFVPEGIVITIARSKTDQEGEGRRIAVPNVKGSLCPVNALTQLLSMSKVRSGPIFRPLLNSCEFGDTHLTGASVALIIKRRAEQAGLHSLNFSGHSLRAGFATAAARSGVGAWAIMRHTGHKSEKTVQRYIRYGELFKSNPLISILKSG